MCVHIASIHSENLSSYLSFHYIQDQSEKTKQNNSLKSNIIRKEIFFSRNTSQESWEVCRREADGVDNQMTSRLCVKSQTEAAGAL